MEKGWVVIFTTNSIQEAELIKALLAENDIPAVGINKQSSAHLIGEVEVYVPNTDVMVAKQIISKHQEN